MSNIVPAGASRSDIYSRLTERIIAELKAGERPWVKPWRRTHSQGPVVRPLRHNGTPYRGVNVLLLWGEMLARGYVCPTWMTCRQALEAGGQVRRGETGSLVVYASRFTTTGHDDTDEAVERENPFM